MDVTLLHGFTPGATGQIGEDPELGVRVLPAFPVDSSSLRGQIAPRFTPAAEGVR
jgi:hypothetical protein